MKRILVVDDEPTILSAVATRLRAEAFEVETAVDGPSAVATASAIQPDLVVLDVMLPSLDGFEVCRILRQEMSMPILMLTARADEVDKIVGLEVGADDYLTKPFSMRELLARVKALLRRVRLIREELATVAPATEPAVALQVLVFGSLVLDLSRHEIRLNDQPLALKPKEYELLVYFAQHRGIVLSRDHILENVWGWDYTGDSRTVDVHIRWLREKIELDPSIPTRLITVRGAGYRFEG